MFTLDPYIVLIDISLIVIASYFFSQFSKKTNIPSVLLLIGLGIGLRQLAEAFEIKIAGRLEGTPLELLGIVGLTMIVLEAALDLKLKKEKMSLILISLASALVGLVITSLGIAYLFQYLFEADFFTAMVYAVPFGIMSSAIIIPSLGKLAPYKKEFLIYESTFSDILGIMFFYFLLGNQEAEGIGEVIGNVSWNIGLTVLLSLLVGYVMVILLQRLTGEVKLFLLISMLILLYSIGKLQHLSPLLMVLTFGLLLNNYELFFRGRLAKWVDGEKLEQVEKNFHVITLESAFVVRTFFFVVFGITIDFSSLADGNTALLGLGMLGLIYASRVLHLGALARKHFMPALFIAPRGLITILLSFGIPSTLQLEGMNGGAMLYVILGSSVVMTAALLSSPKSSVEELTLGDLKELDKRIEEYKVEED